MSRKSKIDAVKKVEIVYKAVHEGKSATQDEAR